MKYISNLSLKSLLIISISLAIFTTCKKDKEEPKPDPVDTTKSDTTKPDTTKPVVLKFNAPTLRSPADNYTSDKAFVTLVWDTIAKAKRYEVNISETSAFTTVLYSQINADSKYSNKDSLANKQYYWRVRAGNDTLWSDWSTARAFTINVVKVDPLPAIVPAGEKVVKLSTTKYQFTEGPMWDGKGTLYFEDFDNNNKFPGQNNNFIMTYKPADGSFAVFRSKSNKSNGLMFDAKGRLIVCEGDSARITALNDKGQVVEVLADTYEGKRFNSPNDLVIDKDGGIYFTDPTWGTKYQGVCGVYYRAANGTVTRVISNMSKPNGIILSPDNSKLYVDDYDSQIVRVYDITSPGVISTTYSKLTLKSSGPDGVAMDVEGNFYVATSTGIQVFTSDYRYITTITVPEGVSNCDFGGDDMKTLFITASTSLYSIKLNIAGQVFPIK